MDFDALIRPELAPMVPYAPGLRASERPRVGRQFGPDDGGAIGERAKLVLRRHPLKHDQAAVGGQPEPLSRRLGPPRRARSSAETIDAVASTISWSSSKAPSPQTTFT